MHWIEGPTLDLYIDEMIDRKDVLLHLSQEWLKLVSALRQSGVAHGDLQHGNIIVEHGALRLVDHDGMFVPEMTAWSSSEVGHQHYQHPLRDPQHFDADLDNFSSIVIYLTFISLMERPSLWKEHHDENLLFTKSDFLNPSASQLFAKIKEIGPEHRAIAEVLEKASTGKPSDVPNLLDLVSVKSTLPSWMSAVELESQSKTREIKIDPQLRRGHPRWISTKSQSSSVPASPTSETVTTIFGAPVTPPPPYGLAGITDPTAVWKNTPKYARDMLGKTFLWWYWGIYLFLKIFGLNLVPAFLFAVVSVLLFCLAIGFARAKDLALKAAASSTKNLPGGSGSGPALPTPKQRAPVSITSADPIIGNTALNIYHLTNCEWVNRILNKNRVTFRSALEATSAGYKPCRICSPTTI
jgi:hypothetical protein